jgi:hypothetical protein
MFQIKLRGGTKLVVKFYKASLDAEKQKLCYLKAKNGMRYRYALTEAYI